MKNKMLAILAVGLLSGPMAAQASFLYTFDETATGNSVSFTVPEILMGSQDPFTQVIGQTIGGFTIADAVFAPSGATNYCVSFAAPGTDALACGLSSATGIVGTIGNLANPFSVGTYNIDWISVGGFALIDRLTIEEVAEVPEPGTLALLGLGLAGLGFSKRRKTA